eukprot:TRINITY_DN6808_c0_g1_i1.p1 TRINITY_DN6808_c0_g1~~TRINITY_DN6808_c0_g1_i1.p1  ORF type:complete len:417 (+),score=69.98 TRINITY_DN6808_c0_g1_i1:412-1662(+)
MERQLNAKRSSAELSSPSSAGASKRTSRADRLTQVESKSTMNQSGSLKRRQTRNSAKRNRVAATIVTANVDVGMIKRQLTELFAHESKWIPQNYKRKLRTLGVPVALRQEIVGKMSQVLGPFVSAGASIEALPVAVLMFDRYLCLRSEPIRSSSYAWRMCGAALILASKYIGRAPLHLGSLAYSMSLDEHTGPRDFKLLERELIHTLDWDFHVAAPYDFIASFMILAVRGVDHSVLRDYSQEDIMNRAFRISDLLYCNIGVTSSGPSAAAAVSLYLALCGCRADRPTALDIELFTSRKYGMFGIRHAMRHSQFGNGGALDDLLDHCVKLLLPELELDDVLKNEPRMTTTTVLTPDKAAPDVSSPLPIGKMLSFPSPKHTVREQGASPGPPRRRQRSMNEDETKEFQPINPIRHSVV